MTEVDPVLDKLQQYEEESKKTNQYVAAISASLGALAAGSSLAWTSPAATYLEEKYGYTNDEISWIGSFLAIGALAAAVPAGICADKIGRKYTLLLAAVPLMLTWLFLIFANSLPMFLIGRFFAGVGTATIFVTAPLYISEIAENKLRGTLGTLFALFICCGIMVMFIVAIFASVPVMNVVLSALPVCYAVLFFFCPETPAYLVYKNDTKGAERSFCYLRGANYNYRDELQEIQKQADERSRQKMSIAEVLQSRGNIRGIVACIGLFAFQQLSGINYIMFYSESIFKSAGSSMDPTVSSIILALVQVVLSVLVVFIIEKYNRKSFLLFSSVVAMVCLCILGLCFHLQSHKIHFAGMGMVPLVCLVLFVVAFSVGFGPVPWMLLSELLIPEIVGLVSGICVLTFWSLVFFVTKVFPTIAVLYGGHTAFYIFSIFMAACTAFIWFFVPETRGLTLKDIQKMLNSSTGFIA